MSPSSLVDDNDLAEYEDTPWLTALVNFCAVVGVFIGAYAAIFLVGELHHGFVRVEGFIVILAVDLVVNLGARILRRRRRREKALQREQRRVALERDIRSRRSAR